MQPSSLVIQDKALQLLPRLALKIGLNEALMLQQIHFLCSIRKGGKIIGGVRWIWNTVENWRSDHFPFWSIKTISRTISNLEKLGLVKSCQPDGRMSRKKHYRVDYRKVGELFGPKMLPNQYRNRSDNLMAIGFATYKDYLKSELWAGIKQRVIETKGEKCVACGKKSQCVHHSSYDTDVLLGEKIDALYPLCNRCHGKIELKKNGKKEYSAEAIHAKLLKMIERKDYLVKIGASQP